MNSSVFCEGSHLPDLLVTSVTSTEGNNSDSELTSGKFWQFHCSTVALSLTWASLHSGQRAIINEESVALWSIFVLATWWEESSLPLIATENNILFNGVLE